MTTSEEKTGPAPISAVVVESAVSFREIDRTYDLFWNAWSRQYLVTGDDGRAAVATVYSWLGKRESTDERGRPISAAARILPGVYRGMRTKRVSPGQSPVFLRGFDRKASRAIDGKRVYVFRAKDAARSGLTLLHELHFENGRFRHCDADGNQVGPWRNELLLPALTCTPEACVLLDRYFVWLSPRGLPRETVQALRGEGRSRNVDETLTRFAGRVLPLWDPFFTDATAPSGEYLPLDVRAPVGTTRRLRMHLFDPIAELVTRSEAFQRSYEAWTAESARLAKDAKYRVACHVRALVQGDDELEKLVGRGRGPGPESLHSYLAKVEVDARRLRAAVENAGMAVLRWASAEEESCAASFTLPSVGPELYQQARWEPANTYVLKPASLADLTREPSKHVALFNWPATPVSTPFLSCLEDFRRGDDKEYLEDLLHLTGACLTNTVAVEGAEWMLDNLLPRIEGAPEKTTAALLAEKLEALTEPAGNAKKWWGFLMRVAVPVVRARDTKGFEDVRKELFRAAAKVESPLGKLASTNLDAVKLAQEALTLADKLSTFWDRPDTLGAWKAVTSAVSTYDELTGLWGRYELPEIHWSRGVFKGVKLTPVTVLVESVDCALSIKEAFSKRNNGAAFAAGVGAAGAMLGIAGGAILAGTGVGLALVIGSMLAKAAGSALEEHFDDLRVFLRHTPWGEGVDDEVTSWSKGKPLAALRASTALLEEGLIELLYGDFEPNFSFEKHDIMFSDTRLQVAFKGKHRPPTAMKWDVSLSFSSAMGNGWFELGPEGAEALVGGQPTVLVPHGGHRPPTGARVHLTGHVVLDVFGDGRFLLRRRIDHREFV